MAITQSPFQWFNKGIQHLSLPGLLTDDIRIALCTSTYVPNSDTHEFYDVDITNELPTANGYTVGGIALTTKSIAAGASPGEYIFLSDNASWTATGGVLTAHYYIMYNNTPASSKPLIGWAYLDYNAGVPQDVTVEATYDLIVTIGATGWIYTEAVDGVVV